jgi:hypothetical protein
MIGLLSLAQKRNNPDSFISVPIDEETKTVEVNAPFFQQLHLYPFPSFVAHVISKATIVKRSVNAKGDGNTMPAFCSHLIACFET